MLRQLAGERGYSLMERDVERLGESALIRDPGEISQTVRAEKSTSRRLEHSERQVTDFEAGLLTVDQCFQKQPDVIARLPFEPARKQPVELAAL